MRLLPHTADDNSHYVGIVNQRILILLSQSGFPRSPHQLSSTLYKSLYCVWHPIILCKGCIILGIGPLEGVSRCLAVLIEAVLLECVDTRYLLWIFIYIFLPEAFDYVSSLHLSISPPLGMSSPPSMSPPLGTNPPLGMSPLLPTPEYEPAPEYEPIIGCLPWVFQGAVICISSSKWEHHRQKETCLEDQKKKN